MDHDESIRRASGFLLLTRPPAAQFLLMRHADRWDLPKGHCEPGESFLETALRETAEETGIDPDTIDVDSEFRFELNYPVRYRRHGDRVFDKRVVLFLGWVADTFRPKLTEHPDYRWFDWNPPHRIQTQTIDPLLRAVAAHLASDRDR